jgi:DNA-binding HxlR family transcriptional regulator
MRSYAQYCAIAKALDVIGDRWTLLILRELMVRSACRFTDIRNGLPGIASNLLTERLRELENAGLVRREAAPAPVAATLYSLTVKGREVGPVLDALGSFGAHLLHSPDKHDLFQSHWLCVPLGLELKDQTPKEPAVTVVVRTGNEPIVLQTHRGRVRARPGSAHDPDATVSGSPPVVMKFLLGHTSLQTARRQGLRIAGDQRAVTRLRPSV